MFTPPLFLAALTTASLFGLGLALTSVPIIIHLLNKRKFKIVHWAAMDFLLQADKMNRRRIRIEDLLLLLLRCLAVALIGLLVARPFFSRDNLNFLGGARYERFVLLDDSLSTSARTDNVSSFEHARATLSKWLLDLSGGKTDEAFTLVLASNPDQPLYNGQPLNDSTIGEISETLKTLQPSDRAIDLHDALETLAQNMSDQEQAVNRSLYIFSDFRQGDWETGEEGLVNAIGSIAKKAAGAWLVDVGSDETGNLVLHNIAPTEKAVIAGAPTSFEVTVENTGVREANDIQVQLTAGEALPLKAHITSVPAGESASVSFSYTFPVDEDQPDRIVSVPVVAQVTSPAEPGIDRLQADNQRFYAARVLPGIPTLLVDGDPSEAYGRAETFFLRRALAPRGPIRSGLMIDVVSDTEFDNVNLDDYQVVHLANVYRLSEERIASLEAWIAAGNGLVISLGDQADAATYERFFDREGQGFFKLSLDGVQGDETEQQWVGFRPTETQHPVLALFEGDNNPLLEEIKIFRWWTHSPIDETNEDLRVLARFTDEDQTPAMVETTFGDGRVVIIATPLDIDWNTWPREVSFPIVQQELARYLARGITDRWSLPVGEQIVQPVNLAQYQPRIQVTQPNGSKIPLQARAIGQDQSTHFEAALEPTRNRGFYRIQLERNDSTTTDEVIYAANIDPAEGNLQRADLNAIERTLKDKGVALVRELDSEATITAGPQKELWPWILGLLLLTLLGEQAFAHRIGQNR